MFILYLFFNKVEVALIKVIFFSTDHVKTVITQNFYLTFIDRIKIKEATFNALIPLIPEDAIILPFFIASYFPVTTRPHRGL